jgi:hypothetical protein
MDINIEKPFVSFLGQILPLILSFLDDALLLLLSNLGLRVSWLQWLSPVILSCTLAYWAVQLWQNLDFAWIGKKQQKLYELLRWD